METSNGSKHTTSPSSSSSSVTSYFLSTLVFLSCMWFIIYYARNLFLFLEYVKQLEEYGNLLFIISYIPTGLPFAFISYYIPLSLSSGFLYGYVLGFLTTTIGSILSACTGFLVTRKFCRSWIESRIESSVRLSAIMTALEAHSFKITLIIRFLPVPFGLQNGLCAMTNIPLELFFLATLLGLIPENTLLIYFGHNVKSISDLASGNLTSFTSYQKVLLVLAILALILLFFAGKTILDSSLSSAMTATNRKSGAEGDEEMGTLVDSSSSSSRSPRTSPRTLPRSSSLSSSISNLSMKMNVNAREKIAKIKYFFCNDDEHSGNEEDA